MDTVAEHPNHFPVRREYARMIKSKLRAAKGPAQPQPGRNKRKARQAQRRAFQKLRRENRRELVAAFNAQREQMEAQRAEQEAQAEQRRAEIATEPTFDITDLMGNVILAGVPKSMIKAQEVEYQATPLDAVTTPGIVLSGNVEKALAREQE